MMPCCLSQTGGVPELSWRPDLALGMWKDEMAPCSEAKGLLRLYVLECLTVALRGGPGAGGGAVDRAGGPWAWRGRV